MTLPVRYRRDSQTGRDLRISAVPTVSYDIAPLPWPKPTHHPISPTPPPTPGLDCTYTTDLDWDGEDLRDYSSDNKEECCRTCSTSSSCMAAVWKKNEIPIPRQ